MKVKVLLLCLMFALLTSCQMRSCSSIRCPAGSTCQGGRCFVSYQSLINTYTIPIACTNKSIECSQYEVCRNNKCISTVLARPKPTQPGVVNRGSCPYGMYYCNQNIFHFCSLYQRVRKPNSQGYVVWLKGPNKTTTLRQQKLGKDEKQGYKLVWNYHVIFIQKIGRLSRVFDFDSRLPWGVNFERAWKEAFETKKDEPPVKYRIVPYKKYLENFSMSRENYMQKVGNGTFRYRLRPPTSNIITVNKKGQANGFNKFYDFNYVNQKEYGKVVSAMDFKRFFLNQL